jgi:hypothetical protein
MNELRITDTNSVNDSKGRALGLEGNDFLYVVGAFVVSLALYLGFTFVIRTGMATALLFSLPPFLAVTAWVLFLRRNRPEGYAEDFFDDLVNGEGWSLVMRNQPVPPGRESHAR